jgi:BolA protein
MDVRTRIEERLAAALGPCELLDVIDQSAAHAGHAGARESGGGHFNVIVVSQKFDGLSAVARQRLIYAALAEEMRGSIHALSMSCLTPAEYADEA